jgi:hypothetical protein
MQITGSRQPGKEPPPPATIALNFIKNGRIIAPNNQKKCIFAQSKMTT